MPTYDDDDDDDDDGGNDGSLHFTLHLSHSLVDHWGTKDNRATTVLHSSKSFTQL